MGLIRKRHLEIEVFGADFNTVVYLCRRTLFGNQKRTLLDVGVRWSAKLDPILPLQFEGYEVRTSMDILATAKLVNRSEARLIQTLTESFEFLQEDLMVHNIELYPRDENGEPIYGDSLDEDNLKDSRKTADVTSNSKDTVGYMRETLLKEASDIMKEIDECLYIKDEKMFHSLSKDYRAVQEKLKKI